MMKLVHRAAGVAAMLLVASFWSSSIVAEIWLGPEGLLAVKRAIVYTIPLLIACVIAAGGSGTALARGRTGRLLAAKQRRMKISASLGLLVLLPAAVFLYRKAAVAEFDAAFHAVQAAELIAGLVQLVLFARNARDGLRLAGRGSRRTATGTAAGLYAPE
jgi:hypothetical protein